MMDIRTILTRIVTTIMEIRNEKALKGEDTSNRKNRIGDPNAVDMKAMDWESAY